jgi:formylglycine-generating enzyme required for sulfatase activity
MLPQTAYQPTWLLIASACILVNSSPCIAQNISVDEALDQIIQSLIAVPETELTGAFYMMEHEVTNEIWDAVLAHDSIHPCPRCPHVYTSWLDAMHFCNEVAELTGLSFRLPTMDEWEQAATYGEARAFNFSGSNDIDKVAWYADNSDGHLHEVKTKMPNAMGFYDLTGNAVEWTSTRDICFVRRYDDREVCSYFIRGGAASEKKKFCKLNYYITSLADYDMNVYGFRLAVTSLKGLK